MVDEVRDERPRPWSWFEHEIIDVYAAQMGPIGVSVYMALLRFCGPTQTCYPSYETLESRLGLSHQSVWRGIQKLVELKLISVEQRMSGPKGRASNVYTIQRPSMSVITDDERLVPNRNKPKASKQMNKVEVSSPQEHTKAEVSSPQEQTVSSLRELEVDTKRRTKEDTPPTPSSPSALSLRFDEFWKVYPKKKAKGKALKTWLRIKPNEALLETILAALTQQKTSTDWRKEQGKFIPWPAKWLDEERWEDVEYSPVEQRVVKFVE